MDEEMDELRIKITLLSDEDNLFYMAGYNFFYYEVIATDSESIQKNLEDILKGSDGEYDFDSDIRVKRKQSGRAYKLKIGKYESEDEDNDEEDEPTRDFFYSYIVRTQQDTEYCHLDGRTDEIVNLSSKTGDNGETGEIKRDIVSFAFTIMDGKILVLMEQGFQYPGIGVFIDYMRQIINQDDITFIHKHKVKEKKKEQLKKVFGKKLKRIVMTFKKNADLSSDSPVEEFLGKLGVTEDYSVNIEFSLGKSKRGSFMKVKDLLLKEFAVDNVEELLQIDFASIMSSFKFDYWIDENASVSDEENLLRSFESESIQLDKNEIDDFEVSPKKACRYLIDKVNGEDD